MNAYPGVNVTKLYLLSVTVGINKPINVVSTSIVFPASIMLTSNPSSLRECSKSTALCSNVRLGRKS